MTSTDETDGWLDVEAAARHLALGQEWIRKLCRDGKLHYRRAGNGPCAPYRFKRWWLDAFLEGQPATAVAAEEQRQSGRQPGPRRGRKRAPAGSAA